MPFAIYEILPYFCLAVGATAILGIDAVFGQLSGALLLILGFVILKMRIQHRRSFASNKFII